MLKISHIYKTFNPGTADAKLALNDLCLDVNKGDFITAQTALENQRCSTP